MEGKVKSNMLKAKNCCKWQIFQILRPEVEIGDGETEAYEKGMLHS